MGRVLFQGGKSRKKLSNIVKFKNLRRGPGGGAGLLVRKLHNKYNSYIHVQHIPVYTLPHTQKNIPII